MENTTSRLEENNKGVDEQQARELVLWFENTESLYNRRDAWIANYNRKIKRGVFDEALAIKGIINLVEQVRADYNQHFPNELGKVNAATKQFTAFQIYESSIKEGLNL
jgi:hypothetical protein